MLTLLPYGDRELWYLADIDGKWSIPLFVDWKLEKGNIENHYAVLNPAIGLYTNQHRLVLSILGVHDIQGRKDQWVLPRNMVEALLKKAPGITPMAYYRWHEDNHPALPASNERTLSPKGPKSRVEQGSREFEAFINHISEMDGLPSSVVRIVIRAIGDRAPRWMIENRRPLDLGFCRLIAAPFRPNWKEIISAKFKKWALLSILHGPKKDVTAGLEAAGLPEAFCSMHNIGIKKMGNTWRIEYTLEAVPNQKFEKAVNDIEAKRLACGQGSYVASFEKTVESLYIHLVESLEHYLRKTAQPFAQLSQRCVSGFLRFIPTSGIKTKVGGVAIKNLPVHIISPDKPFSVFGENRGATLVRPKDKKVLSLPRISSSTEDVRRSDVDEQLPEPDDAEGGTIGVPLLDAGEGEDTGGPVLPLTEVRTDEPPRVD